MCNSSHYVTSTSDATQFCCLELGETLNIFVTVVTTLGLCSLLMYTQHNFYLFCLSLKGLSPSGKFDKFYSDNAREQTAIGC